MKMMQLAWIATFICASAALLPAALPSNLVQAELLANVSAVKAGEPFLVGVRFHIQKGWHIYWKNPGDSGLETRVKWKLPDGFAAGELQFPVPQRFVLPGDIVNYGYEDEVMLIAQITPPKDLAAGKMFEIAADASWLVCQESCVPGKASVKIELTSAEQSAPANRDVFDAWMKRMPVPAEKLSGVGFTATPLDLSTGQGSSEISATLAMDDLAIPSKVSGLKIDISSPQKSTNGTRYTLNAAVRQGQHISAQEIEVLIGRYRVTVPIVGAAGPATAPSSP